MANEKKNSSLLFQLYQKYKETKDGIQQNPEIEVPDIIKEVLQEDTMAVEAQVVPETLRYLQPLYEYYTRISQDGQNPTTMMSIFEFETWVLLPVAQLPVFQRHAQVIQHTIEIMGTRASFALKQMDEALFISSQKEDAQDGEVLPLDCQVQVKVLDNKMSAIFLGIPPYNGGRELDQELVDSALGSEGVVSGVDVDLLYQIEKKKSYLQVFEIAKGIKSVDGVDGRIEDCTDCRKTKTMHQDEQGKVDFRDLDLYEDIQEHQVICELIPPIEGKWGMDVQGNKISFLPGKIPVLPVGKNTVKSEDGLKLLSTVSGYVSYRSGRYNVEPTLVIHGNVDYSVGNIDFSGDVMISGDVCSCFTIKAEGNITVMGMVEGAQLIAGGNITIKKGMNGNHSGVLNAIGEVHVSYLESCKIFAGGAVYADTVIACDIFCDDAVFVEGMRGVVIGGTITALKSVEARMIGSKSNRETTIILGETPHMVLRRKSVEAELKETQSVLEKLKLNITYLTKHMDTLSPEKRGILSQIMEQNTLYEWRRKELSSKLLKLMEDSLDYSRCYVRCNMMFPVTKLEIGSASTVVTTVLSTCNAILAGDEIVIRTGE